VPVNDAQRNRKSQFKMTARCERDDNTGNPCGCVRGMPPTGTGASWQRDVEMTSAAKGTNGEGEAQGLMMDSSDETDSAGSSSRKQPLSNGVICALLTAFMLLSLLAFYPQQTRSSGSKSIATTPAETPPLSSILSKAGQRALGGGLSGAFAGLCQVAVLMWLRTAMNYQYRHGGSLRAALRTLYAQGGIPRFYQGVFYALLQNPLSYAHALAMCTCPFDIRPPPADLASPLTHACLARASPPRSPSARSLRSTVVSATPLPTSASSPSLRMRMPRVFRLGCVQRVARWPELSGVC
jgi:hypothetical protein